MTALGKVLRLTYRERWLLVQATLLLAAVRLGLWLLPFRALHRLLAYSRPSAAIKPKAERPPVDRIAWAVATAGRYVPGAGKCLTQALAAQILLRRAGHSAQLRIGVARAGAARLKAHAWVECEGIIAIGGGHDLERYTPLPAWETIQA